MWFHSGDRVGRGQCGDVVAAQHPPDGGGVVEAGYCLQPGRKLRERGGRGEAEQIGEVQRRDDDHDFPGCLLRQRLGQEAARRCRCTDAYHAEAVGEGKLEREISSQHRGHAPWHHEPGTPVAWPRRLGRRRSIP